MKNPLDKKLKKIIEGYVKPVHYSLSCEGCREGLAMTIREFIEKNFTRKK